MPCSMAASFSAPSGPSSLSFRDREVSTRFDRSACASAVAPSGPNAYHARTSHPAGAEQGRS